MKKPKKKSGLISTWVVFWEGAGIDHFFGIWWCLWWTLAWLGVGLILRFGIFIGKKSSEAEVLAAKLRA
jgi:hypothetical protein